MPVWPWVRTGCSGCVLSNDPQTGLQGGANLPGPAVHDDDHVRRELTAERPDQIWLADITDHPTGEGKFTVCGVRDQGPVFQPDRGLTPSMSA